MPALPSLSRRRLLAVAAVTGAGLLVGGCSDDEPAEPAPWQQRLRAATADAPRRIGILGDSISFGAGNTAPKYLHSYPGQLRTALAATYGDAGTGWVLMNHDLWPVTATNLGWEPRLRVTGSVRKAAAGPFRRSCASIPAGGRRPRDHVEFVATGSTFSTLVAAQPRGRSRQLVSVDGGEPVELANTVAGPRGDLPPRPGTAPGQLWTDIPTGSPGEHRVRIWGGGGRCDLVAVSAQTGRGAYLVDTIARSRESLETFLGPDDPATARLFGLPYVDTFGVDLLVVALGVNDYNAGRPLDAVEQQLRRLVARQLGTGGDVLLTFPPVTSPTLHPAGGPTYAEYVARFAAVANALAVPFLDLSALWGATFAEADAVQPPKYADHAIHPSDSGAVDIAARLRTTLGL